MSVPAKTKLPIMNGGTVTFVDNTAQVNLTALTGDAEQAILPIPSPLLALPETYVTGPAVVNYGSATSLDQLDGMLGDAYLQYRFFHLVAEFPDFTKLGFFFTELVSHAVIHYGDNQRAVAWWLNQMPEVFLCFPEGEGLREDRPVDAKDSKFFNPSELLYALSIIAQHGSMGSEQFVIFNTAEKKTILFNDHENPNFFMGVYFSPVEQD